jgi:hypothetical protein
MGRRWLFPVLLLGLSPLVSQAQESGGVADIAIEGYYLGGDSQPFTGLTGLNVAFREYIPVLGLLSGNVQGYDETTRGRVGQNFVTLNALRWKDRVWTLTGGDFRFRTNIVAIPFTNYVYPEMGVRGARVDMADGRRQYTLFWGQETLQEGPRITFRVGVPQTVLGATVRENFGTRLQVGIRYLGFSSSEDQVAANPMYFPPGSEFRRSDSLTAQSAYQLGRGLSLYSDVTLSHVEFAATAVYPRSMPLSWLAGARWQTKRLTVLGNYGSLSRAALPMVGYYFGDRRGPYAEIHYKAARAVELFGSALRSMNNLEKDPFLPDLSIWNVTAGANLNLPGRLNVSGQYSKLGLDQVQALAAASDAAQSQKQMNTQASVSVNRSLSRHNLNLLLRDLNLNATNFLQKQRSVELQDNIQYARFGFGGAVRMQQTASSGQLQNSVFFRGNGSWRWRGFSVYGQFEIGNDLINKTLFSTNSVNTTVAGIGIPLGRGWGLQAEAFRTTLLTALNPVSILVYQSQGAGVSDILNNFNQWSFFLRMNRHVHWGAALPDEGNTLLNAVVYGSIEGFVYEGGTDPNGGAVGVAGVSVLLDRSRTAITDESGRYRFADVPEGPHSVELNMEDLAADLSPGPPSSQAVAVKPRGVARADLRVVKTGSAIQGVVRGLAKEDEGSVRLESIVVNLSPTGSYTTCDGRGEFGFYNLVPGKYEVSIDKGTLPEGYVLVSDQAVEVELNAAGAAPELVFQIDKRAETLPVRKVFESELR